MKPTASSPEGGRARRWLLSGFHFLVLMRLMGGFKPLFVRTEEAGIRDASSGFNYIAFVVLAGAFIFLCLFYWGRLPGLLRRSWIFWPFLGYIFLSIFWSQAPFLSFAHFASFFLVSFYAYLVYLQLDLWQFLRLLFAALYFALASSLVFVAFFGQVGIQYRWGRLLGWNGIFGHKNHLGIFSALFLVLGFHLFRRSRRRRDRVLAASGMALGLVTLIGSRSISSALILFLLLGAWILAGLSRRSMGLAACLLIAAIASGALAGKYVEANSDRLLGNWLAKEGTFTGRTELWRYVVPHARARLLCGYGFNAFWVERTAAAETIWALMDDWQTGNAHNGFLELILELGVLGLALFLAIEAAFLLRSLRSRLVAGREGRFFLSFFLFFLLANFPEARFLNGFNIWWFLLLLLYVHMAGGERARLPREPQGEAAADGSRPVDTNGAIC